MSEAPNEIDALDEEAGRLLFTQECVFLAGSDRLEGLPPFELPEIAFAGRSNVGKSSLLNALANRIGLARVMVLIDSRHGVKPGDRDLMKRLDERAVSYQVILTKADEPKPSALAATLGKVAVEIAKHPAAHPDIVVTSATDGRGMPELRARLQKLAVPRRSR